MEVWPERLAGIWGHEAIMYPFKTLQTFYGNIMDSSAMTRHMIQMYNIKSRGICITKRHKFLQNSVVSVAKADMFSCPSHGNIQPLASLLV